MSQKIDCKDCEFKKLCKKEYGKEHQAVHGSHFCRYSWKECNCKCIQRLIKKEGIKFNPI